MLTRTLLPLQTLYIYDVAPILEIPIHAPIFLKSDKNLTKIQVGILIVDSLATPRTR